MTEPTAEQQRNLALAGGGLQAWIEGDREAAIATFSDEIEIYVPPELGNAGSYRGLEGFEKWNEAWEEAWSDNKLKVEAIEAVGDSHVIVRMRNSATGSASGIEVENVLGWVMCIRDDRLTHISLHPDFEHARAYALEREAGGEQPG